MNIIDLKNYRLTREFELTPTEMELLKALCTNRFITYEVLMDRCQVQSIDAVQQVVFRLKEKTNLKFRVKKNYGYKLEEELYIDY